MFYQRVLPKALLTQLQENSEKEQKKRKMKNRNVFF